jgi:hypothetical protein
LPVHYLALILSLPGIILWRASNRSSRARYCPICFSLYLAAFCFSCRPIIIPDVQYWIARSLYFLLSEHREKAFDTWFCLFPLFYYLAGADALIYIGLFILTAFFVKPSKVLLPVRINWSGFNFGICIQ